MRFGQKKRQPNTSGASEAVSVNAFSSEGADSAVGVPGQQPAEFKSKRGRRAMALLITLLVLLLLLATVFLLNLIRPKGEIATKDDAAGVTWVRSIYGYGASADEQLVLPSSVAFARNGDVVIPNVGTTAVRGLRFSSSGVFKDMFAGSQKGYIAYPSAVDVAPDGRMYFVQGPRNEVLVIDQSGKKTELVLGIEEPSAIDVTDDRMAVGSKSGWVILDLEGNVLLGPIGQNGQGDDQYDVVSGIAIDAKNSVYVVDSYNNRISKFDSAGKRLWLTQSGSPANRRKNTGGNSISASDVTGDAKLQTPSAAALDSAGRLLVVDPLDFSIAAFDTADGKFVAKWGTFGQDEGKFMYPTGMAYDAERDWVAIADTMNNRVQIVRLPGTGGDATAAIARSLTGPIRACLIPLALLLLLMIVGFVYRWLRRRGLRNTTASATEATLSE